MRKRGKRINQNVAVIPLGMKRNDYDMIARTALVAFKSGIVTDKHIGALVSLAYLCEHLHSEPHIMQHAASVIRLCAEAQDNKRVTDLQYIALETSTDVLLKWFHLQKNFKVINAAMAEAKRITA